MGPGGTFDENVYYRRILNEYPDPMLTESKDDRSTISSTSNRSIYSPLAHPSAKNIKANAPFRCNHLLIFLINSLNDQLRF